MGFGKMILIDVGLFCCGMKVNTGIYYKCQGAFVLLCKNVLFTEDLLAHLHEISGIYGGVYVRDNEFEKVWNESLRQYSKDTSGYEGAYLKVRAEYKGMLTQMSDLMGDIENGGRVSKEKVGEISGNILKSLENTDLSLIFNCVNMIHRADVYLYTHSINVAVLNGLIAKWLNLDEAEISKMIKVGLLHDLGKLKIDKNILNKPGKLTKEEFAEVKKHPIFTHQMLKRGGETDETVLDAVLHHHEKLTGVGYPDGLKGEQICRASRITAISDIYDAMVSKRCYKEACSPFEVLDLFDQSQFSELDMGVVNSFLKNVVYLLIGMRVKLSNGKEGEVVFVQSGKYLNPVVKIGDLIVAIGDKYKFMVNGKNGIS